MSVQTVWYRSITEQVRRKFANADLAEHMSIRPKSPDVVDDIQDSRRFREKMSAHGWGVGSRCSALGFSTDGLNPYRDLSSQTSWWPIVLQILNLPEHLRKKPENMILVGIYSSPNQKSPRDLQVFMNLAVDEIISTLEQPVMLEDVSRAGVTRWFPWSCNVFCASFDYDGA
jgi:hypothetical protein